MKRIPVLRVYLLAVAGAGFVVTCLSVALLVKHAGSFAWGATLTSPWSPLALALFALLAATASSFVILVPEEQGQASSHNLATVGTLAAVVVFPAYLAVLIVGIGAIFAQLAFKPAGQRAWQFTVFNIGNFVLSAAASAAVFAVFGGRSLLILPQLPQQAPQLLLAVGGMASVSYVVSYGLTVMSVWLLGQALARKSNPIIGRSPAHGPSMLDIFMKSHRNAILPEVTSAIVGILFGYLWLVNPPLAPIALLPLAIIYIAFKNFIRLQEIDRLKSNFIMEVSHELRTPLSSMLVSSELLYHHADELDATNVRDLSRSSYESSNHLFRVVENLLNASTIQSGTLNIHPVPESMDEIVSDAVTQIQPFLESKSQKLEMDLPHDLPEVLADHRHVVQVLINLLTNASKYSDPETVIEIVCRAESDRVKVSVSDQGMGIAPAEQANIFERFYRVPSNIMTSVVGSGLGLTIVKSLVEMHDGEVGVSSTPGAGSTFWFTLPEALMAHA